MRTSLNPLMYKPWDFERTYTTPGTYTLVLSPGKYLFALRGGGGAGGTNGGNSTVGDAASTSYGGNGGAGGMGALYAETRTVTTTQTLTIHVGAGGKTYANGGNGGTGGPGTAANGGNGGGGGEPSYISNGVNNGIYMIAPGGGGGGGGGGAPQGGGKYSPANCSGGGGGGGKYHPWRNPSTMAIRIDSIPGQSGGTGKAYESTAGADGDTTNFPNLYGGDGEYGRNWREETDAGVVKPGGKGGGAGGGGGTAHTSSYDYTMGGCGGGGAGGCYDAGGGATPADGTQGATNPSNVHYEPTSVVNENAPYVPGNYGRGGAGAYRTGSTNTFTTAINGYAGFVYIKRTGWL